MQKELYFFVVPKVFLILKLDYSDNFLNYIKRRYTSFIEEKVKSKGSFFYKGFFKKKKDIYQCRECADKEILEISDFNNIDVCFSFTKKIFCFFANENKYLFDSVLRIIYSIILVDNKGLLLHSAGIIKNNKSVLYIGPTNSGKSTLSKKFPLRKVLSDELCPVVYLGSKFFCFKSPFYSEVDVVYDGLKFFKLAELCFLSGFSLKERVSKMNSKVALRLLLKNTFWLVKNNLLTEKLMETAHKLISSTKQKKIYLKKVI